MPGVRDGLPGKDTRRKEELGTKPRYPTRSASIRGIAQGLGRVFGEKAQVVNVLNMREPSSSCFLRGILRLSCQNRL